MTVSAEVQTRTVTLDVRGRPRPQGSVSQWKTPSGKTATKYPKEVYQWRSQVQQAAAELGEAPFTGAVEVRLGFDLVRPLAHYGTGKNAATVKSSAPTHPQNRTGGDIDKLSRAILDSLTDAGLWLDDAQVVVLVAAKRYASPPGVKITITEL